MSTVLSAGSPPKATGALVIVPADLKRDRRAILDVWERCFPQHTAEGHARRFDWYYQHGPYGPGRCWLLVTQPEGAVVGTAGLGQRRVQHQGRLLRVGVASDFAVDRAYRSVQPALLMQKAVLASLATEFDLIYGLPNEKSIGIFRRLRYQQVGVLDRHVRVLHVAPYLRAVPWLRGMGSVIGFGIDVLRGLVAAENWTSRKNYVLDSAGLLDERFDDLWHRCQVHFPTMGVRDLSFLRWRYRECPIQEYTVLTLQPKSEARLAGFVVCTRQNRRLRIVDFLWDPGLVSADQLLCQVLCWARTQAADSIAFEGLGLKRLQLELRRYGFLPRESNSILMTSSREATAFDDWYFLRGDEDYD